MINRIPDLNTNGKKKSDRVFTSTCIPVHHRIPHPCFYFFKRSQGLIHFKSFYI